MKKIGSVRFINHPILGNLYLDFCDPNGSPVDTIIIAGENGTGKSTVLNCLYQLTALDAHCAIPGIDITFYDDDRGIQKLEYRPRKVNDTTYMAVSDGIRLRDDLIISDNFKSKYPSTAIYSEVDINFRGTHSSTVTSMKLDEEPESRRSDGNLATMVNQLLIDIQDLDNEELAFEARAHPEIPTKMLSVVSRMERFTKAFSTIFQDLSYSRIKTADNRKTVMFTKNGVDVPLDQLSTGEKQIVYRGCFLLKDAEALKGAFVFIDEPEISMHPNWQSKILDYYKAIFTNKQGKQTSQIFTVTHSPFVIHNKSRRNDKVIVLARNNEGKIFASDQPEYYSCDSLRAVEDAFSISGLHTNERAIYVAGRTDEMYLNKAAEVYKDEFSLPEFKWVGYLDDRGQERNTGDSSLKQAAEFTIAKSLPHKTAFLFDCDTGRKDRHTGDVLEIVLPFRADNEKKMKKGIENILDLGTVDTSQFYRMETKEGDYGRDYEIPKLQKMDLAKHVCNLDDTQLRTVFSHLRPILEQLDTFFAHREVQDSEEAPQEIASHE